MKNPKSIDFYFICSSFICCLLILHLIKVRKKIVHFDSSHLSTGEMEIVMIVEMDFNSDRIALQHFSQFHRSLLTFFLRPTWERWHENCFEKLNAVTFNYVIIQHVDMSELWTRKLRWECDIEEKRIGCFNERAQKNVLIWRLHQFSVIMWLQEQKTTPTSRRERCICREAIDILDDATCFRL